MICSEPFSVLRPHKCRIRTKRKLFDPELAAFEDFGIFELSRPKVISLTGHRDMVCSCSWSPSDPTTIASGSMDASVRIWQKATTSQTGVGGTPASFVLKQTLDIMDSSIKVSSQCEKQKFGIPLLSYNQNGNLLAAGCLSGEVCVWDAKGCLLVRNNIHSRAVSCLEWSPSGEKLATSSFDGSTIVWTDSCKIPVKIDEKETEAAVVAVRWRDDSSFAIGKQNGDIYFHDENRPPISLEGHTGDVNELEWQPSKIFLASCSDDCSVKIWNVDEGKQIKDFTEHDREVNSICWNPSGSILASGSSDTTIRIWDIDSDECIQVLDKHVHPVTKIRFSPDGEILAAASNDRIFFWNTREWSLLKTLKCTGGVNDISWSVTGQMIAFAGTNNNLSVVDINAL